MIILLAGKWHQSRCAAIMKNAIQQNMKRPSNAESMLTHRLRRWPNTDSTPGELPVPAGLCQNKEKEKCFMPGDIADSDKRNPRAGVVNIIGRGQFYNVKII